MEINQLIQFKTIAECNTMTDAAEKLHISQPALSTMLRKLEEELGVRLFDRKKNKITLNEAGELALRHANELLAKVEEMKIALKDLARKDNIFKVGFCDPGPMWYCTPRFSMAHPEIEMRSALYLENDDEIHLLENQTYDMLISIHPLDSSDIVSRPFINEQILLSVPEKNSLSAYTQVSLCEISIPELTLFYVKGAFSDTHRNFLQTLLPNSLLHICEDYFVFHHLVRNSDVITFTSRLVRHYRDDGPRRMLIPITDPELSVCYYVSYLKSNKERLNSLIAWTQLCASEFSNNHI